MFRKIIRFFKRLKINSYFKKRGISFKDFQDYVSASITLDKLKREDKSYNDYLKQFFNHTFTLIGDPNASKSK